MKKIALKNATRGTAFDYAGQSWILLENDDGRALCLSEDIIETRAFDEGNCNNFAVASSKEYLNGAYLDNLLEDVNGPNAFLTTELDLTTDDGLKDYGTCTVTIFLLTVDQYGAVDDPKDITTKEYVDAADNALKVKVDALWDFVCTDITSNPFQITFDDLDGLTVSSGIWNTGQRRLEC